MPPLLLPSALGDSDAACGQAGSLADPGKHTSTMQNRSVQDIGAAAAQRCRDDHRSVQEVAADDLHAV